MVENFERFGKRVAESLKKSLDAGNVALHNEILANTMVGMAMMVITWLIVVCWILNEIGVFTADIYAMRFAVVASFVIEVPVQIIRITLRNERSWIKYMLLYALLAQCTVLSSVLGHNVTLVMVIPMVISLRYYDKRLTRVIVWVSAVLFTAATIFCAYFGIVNLNAIKIDPGVELTIVDTIRNAILASGYDQDAYVKSLLVNDLLPRLVIFFAIAAACVKIAKRGKEIIELQSDISTKAARVESELDLATRIQSGMLPCIFPAFSDHTDLELFAFNNPAKEIGGDFYDYFRIDDERVAIVIADVSGKGVGAALFMTISKILVKNQMQLGAGPAYALTAANKQLCENNEAEMFVTVWAAMYDSSTGELTFANAGHNPPVLIRKGEKSEYLTSRPGFVLAGIDNMRFKESTITLNPGDEIVLYTDGVTEATNLADELYGEQRLLDALDASVNLSVQEQLNNVKEDIFTFASGAEQADDITMLGMRIVKQNSETEDESPAA